MNEAQMSAVPRLLIGGVASGVGKTTVSAGLIAALGQRGYRVQPFKAGPDYIDPGYLSAAAGQACRNLDSWLLPPEHLRELFERGTRGADLAVVEGVMGLFDGRADGDEGSSAQIARLLGAPVILVVDVARTSRSAAAVALGFQKLDPDLNLVGIILNNVAGPRHLAWTAGPIRAATGLPVLGYLPPRADLAVPERHLGLVPTAETTPDAGFFDRLARQVEETVDLDALLALMPRPAPAAAPSTSLFPDTPVAPLARLGVARDPAFGFYYEDSLDLLAAWGAEPVPFSPLADERLPRIDGLYLGGGFPEVFAAQLARNVALRADLRRAAADGLPIYAECGGLMYLSEGIVDASGAHHPMVGLVPAGSAMGPRLTLGYRTVVARRDGPVLARGESVRGHEFHWSQLDRPLPDEAAAYAIEGEERREGYQRGSVFASYVHLHFGTRAGLADRFVRQLVDLSGGS